MPGRSGEGNQVEKWEGWGRKSSQWQLYTPLEINANYDAKVTTEQISENQWKKGDTGMTNQWSEEEWK